MRKMKDSGIQWIGEIPEGWEVKKLKFVFDMHFSGVWGNIPGENEVDTVCIRVADFDYPKLSINFHDAMTIRSYKLDEIKLFSLKHGDILIEKSGGGEITPVGRSVVFEKNSIMMCANFIGCLRPKEELNYRFMNYWLYSAYIYGYSKRNVKQTTGIQNLDLQSFLNEFIAVCKENEQQHIADYLDNKCFQIDSIIEAKEKANEKLKEYRQSIIYEAVTKGLDKNVNMKNSGIEWIGEIPEYWAVEKLKYHIEFNPKVEINFDENDVVSFVPMDNLKIGFHVTSTIEFSEVKTGYTRFLSGDILIAKVTPCFENGNLAIADNLICGVGFGSTEINVVRCNSILTKYLFYWFQNKNYIERARFDMFGVAGLKRLIPAFVPESFCAIPTAEEQQQIADYLDNKCSQIDSVIEANEKTIEKLKEYRQSIIYEAVTGKIEI